MFSLGVVHAVRRLSLNSVGLCINWPFRLHSIVVMPNKENVSFPSDNKAGDCPGVLTGDLAKTSMGIVVLQEWWGLNQIIIDEAADISERGNFVTLVPDLYRGKIATDHETAGHYMSDLDWPGAVKDIAAATKYLKTRGLCPNIPNLSLT